MHIKEKQDLLKEMQDMNINCKLRELLAKVLEEKRLVMESNELELLANHSIVFKSADKLAEILLNNDIKKSIYFFLYSFQQLSTR